MQLPKLHYISQGQTPKEHLENIQNACAHGAELVQLRLKGLDPKKVLKAAEEAREITSHFQTRLIINDHYKIAKEVKADGVHLGNNDISPIVAKKHLGEYYFVGGTANTLQDCEALIAKKIDYIGLGPFRFTKTKENLSPVLGQKGYLTIIRRKQCILYKKVSSLYIYSLSIQHYGPFFRLNAFNSNSTYSCDFFGLSEVDYL